MTVVQFTAEGLAQPYGTTQIQEVEIVSLVPDQIIGLVQCRPETDDCRGDVCLPIKVLDGDFNSFLFKFASDDTTGDLIDDYRLEKYINNSWQEVVTGNPDNTLGSESGEKFTFGTFSEYPLYSGYKLDWNKIINLYGQGDYRFKVFNIFDEDEPCLSPPFTLCENTCDNANSTVYISMTSRGNFRNFRFLNRNDVRIYDLEFMDWEDSCRYPARFEKNDIETEELFSLYGNEKNKLNRTEDMQPYNLRLFTSTSEYFNRLYEYGLTSNDIRVSDFNHDAVENLTDIPVVRQSDNTKEKYVNNRLIYNVEIKLKNEFQHGFNQC